MLQGTDLYMEVDCDEDIRVTHGQDWDALIRQHAHCNNGKTDLTWPSKHVAGDS